LLERGRQGIETAVEELREAVQALHPVVLQHAGLEAALKAAADHAARSGGFDHDVSVEPGAAGLRDELVLSLARELLSNAAKHSDASRVEVDVAVEEDQLVLTVRDDGRGMTVGRVKEAPRQGHIGLASLSERVEAIGGQLDIAVASGSGACVTARMPLPGGG
jgi:two-component system NarL family sensor kinase